MNETKLHLTDWDVREGIDEDGGTSWEVWAEGLFVIATVIGFGDETDEEYAKLLASAPALAARVAALETQNAALVEAVGKALNVANGQPNANLAISRICGILTAALAASGTGGENG